MNLNILYKHIGTTDEKLDCLYPIYLLYPQIPRYEIIYDEEYFMPLVKKHFAGTKKPEPGDLLIFKMLNNYHFGIYAGEGKFFHCCKKHKLRVSRLGGYGRFLRGCYRRVIDYTDFNK